MSTRSNESFMNCVSRPLWAKCKSLGGRLGEGNSAPEMSLKGTKGFWMSPCESAVWDQGWAGTPGTAASPAPAPCTAGHAESPFLPLSLSRGAALRFGCLGVGKRPDSRHPGEGKHKQKGKGGFVKFTFELVKTQKSGVRYLIKTKFRLQAGSWRRVRMLCLIE